MRRCSCDVRGSAKAQRLAIRGKATCELRISSDMYDPFLLLDLIERYGGIAH